MRWQGLRRILMGLAMASSLVGCNGDSRADKPDSPPPQPSTTTTTIDVSKVPPTIDVPYVQAVMNALDQRTGDAVRVFVAQRGPNKEWYETFRAVFEEDLIRKLESKFGNFAARALEPLQASPGNPETTVKSVLDASSTCIIAEVDRSFGPLLKDPAVPKAIPGFVQLNTKRQERDPVNRNPTGWCLVADIDANGASIPDNPCP